MAAALDAASPDAVAEEDDMAVRKALRQTVPTFHSPEEVNARAQFAREMRSAQEEELVPV